MKSGFVLVYGRPNVGKSTIINNIIGRKVSIVTPKPQTTRNNIKGIYNDGECEITFIDTPGVHKPSKLLGEVMNEMVYNSFRDADAILFIVDSAKEYGLGDDFLIEKIKDMKCPIILVFNKIDLVNILEITALKEKYKEKLPQARQIECVGTEGFNLDEIIKALKEVLPEGPSYYGGEYYTDKDEVFQIKEIIREKALLYLDEEVPHCVAVYIKNIEWDSSPLEISASISVEKESQKGIIIGEGGKMIKKIGSAARKDIERLLHKHVNLTLTARVDKDWRENASSLKKFGYTSKDL
ncbi:MAG: GTPase Era [Coprobacillus sp.]|nr:GTPase Era [Coprobacillus sp.]